MNRQEHLDWCKKRAFEYIENNDLNNAYASFMSDMSKHEETKDHLGLKMLTILFINGSLSTPFSMHDFIKGFN